ncbi:MAG: hypothetical protein HYY45_10475 [Deltaproteobacteria bacterium]|nr:hypothetical protein [Deltaproteobacteria bacterium]
MRRVAWIFFLLLFYSYCFAGTKQEELPDREVLKLMELLRDWDMIKNLDLMRQMDQLEPMAEPGTEPASQGSQRRNTKDRQK